MLSIVNKLSKPFLVFVFPFLVFTSCNSKKGKPNQDEAIVVRAIQIDSNFFSKNLSLSGNVEAQETIRLGFMVAGKIKYISKRKERQ